MASVSFAASGKNCGATRLRAMLRKRKSWCRKRMCWYATRRGKRRWRMVRYVGPSAGGVKEPRSRPEGDGDGDGERRRNSSEPKREK
jgi:hypothetical protein